MPNEHTSAPETHEVKTLLSWNALSRPYRRRKREFYLVLLFILLCVIVITFLFKEWMLMLVVISIAFLAVVLYTTRPHEVEHQITTQAVVTGNHAYLYKELYDFWFDEKDGHAVLHLHTVSLLPGVLSLLLPDTMDKTKVRDVLVKYIPYREVMPKTFMDKAANWLSNNFPLETKS